MAGTVAGRAAGRRSLEQLLGDCVHCGFCLPACPTYALWGEEMDSPRGRIHLIGQMVRGAPVEGAVTEHLDRCLSCMGCLTACPSGVRYDELIETARTRIEEEVRRPWGERATRAAMFGLFPYPSRLRLARAGLAVAERSGLRRLARHPAVARRLPAVLRAMEAVAPPVAPTLAAAESLPAFIAAQGERRGRVAMLTGCVQSVFFPAVNAATARVLAAEGFDVLVPPGQGCCGALSSHTGRHAEAVRFARATISAFEASGADAVVVNAAGCGSAMKEYERLLGASAGGADAGAGAGAAGWAARGRRFSARVRDLAELLVEVGPRAERHPLELTVAYHDACHLAHAQGIRDQPRALLAAIPGISLREVGDRDLCCGSAGVYNLLQPEAAAELGERKARNVLATGANLLVTSNPGCLMQIAGAAERLGRPIRSAHLAEVLDASLNPADQPRASDAVDG
jgi:glycolate oxidase iron-sulfur subunit